MGKGGKEVWIEACYIPVEQAGKVQRIIKFASDVTAEVLARANLKSQIQAIHRAQAVIEFALDGTILTANPNFLQLMQYQLSEIQGKHHRIFVEPQEATSEQYRQFWRQLQAESLSDRGI